MEIFAENQESQRYHDRKKLILKELSFKKEQVMTVSKTAAPIVAAQDLLFLLITALQLCLGNHCFPTLSHVLLITDHTRSSKSGP